MIIFFCFFKLFNCKTFSINLSYRFFILMQTENVYSILLAMDYFNFWVRLQNLFNTVNTYLNLDVENMNNVL